MNIGIKEKINKVLVQTQKYTRIDNAYFFKGGSWLMIGELVLILRGIILSIILTRMLPKETYGEYRYVLAIFGSLSIFSLTGLIISLTKSVAQKKPGSYKQSFKTARQWSFIGSAILLLSSIYYHTQDSASLSFSLLALSFVFPLYFSGDLYKSYFNGKKLFKKSVKYQTILSIANALGIIAALFFTIKIYYLLFISLFIEALIKYAINSKLIKKTQGSESDPLTVKYGKTLSFIAIPQILSQHFDKILLPFFLGFEGLAIYSIALILPERIKSIYKHLGTLLLPRFAEKEDKPIKKIIFKKYLMLSYATIIGIVIYILLSKYIITILYPDYGESIFFTNLIIISAISFPAVILSTYFKARAETIILRNINFADASLNIIFNIVLIPLFGITGAVISLILRRILATFFIIYYFIKR